LTKETKKQAANAEMKIESTVASFKMSEIPAAAAATLRDFAAEALASHRRDEKIIVFDPGPAAGTAS
jgi:hypothetical protein